VATYCQTVTGKIIDLDSKSPIEYVNIGVVGKNRGTVSDKNGSFSLELPETLNLDTLRISTVGYQPASFKVEDLKRASNESTGGVIVELIKNIHVLSEVVVAPSLEIEEKEVGNKGKLGRVSLESLKDTSLGSEIGTVIKVRKKKTFIKDVNIVIKSSTYQDSILFRVNVYAMENNVPGENILREPIFVSVKMKKGTLTIDLSEYNISVDGDFLITLEWIQEMGARSIDFGAGLSGTSFVRTASQGEWDKFPMGIAFGIFVTLLYLK